jgi:mannose-6-phosphate isomerase-like protein (cupin superfamily)
MQIVRNADLEPTWTVLRAKEPGFMRSLVTWMGGPDGYINTNPRVAIESRYCAVGRMDMRPGNRQPGVHVHTVDEIYVILEGEAESFDGLGRCHRAGPLDCLYIPKGVPHGVRTVGDTTLRLLWVNDDIERWGVSVYLEGPGPHPAKDEVQLVPFRDLAPSRSGDRARDRGFQRWSVSWVERESAGQSRNPAVSRQSSRLGLELTVVEPHNRMLDAGAGARLHVVVKGSATLASDGGPIAIDTQDAIFCASGERFDLQAVSGVPLHVVSVRLPA